MLPLVRLAWMCIQHFHLAYVELKLEQEGVGDTVMSAAHGGSGWETLVFDTSTGTITGTPTAATKVVYSPRVVVGDGQNPAADQVFYLDKIKVGGSTPPPPPPAATVALPLDFD